METSQKEFDAIVVGSGPGGATVARELSLKGKNVLILEWGDNDPVKGNFFQTTSRAYIPGKSFFMTEQGLGIIRGITTGGSSLLYCIHIFNGKNVIVQKLTFLMVPTFVLGQKIILFFWVSF